MTQLVMDTKTPSLLIGSVRMFGGGPRTEPCRTPKLTFSGAFTVISLSGLPPSVSLSYQTGFNQTFTTTSSQLKKMAEPDVHQVGPCGCNKNSASNVLISEFLSRQSTVEEAPPPQSSGNPQCVNKMTRSDVHLIMIVDVAPFPPLFAPPPVCPTAGLRLTVKVQTGSSSAPRPTLDLVYVARAERAKWGWDIPTSRCPESIGLLLCHTGLIYTHPLSSCLATTVFVGYSAFRFDVVLHGCSRFALLLFLLPF